MKCLACDAAELNRQMSPDSWQCPACKRWFAAEAVAVIERLRDQLTSEAHGHKTMSGEADRLRDKYVRLLGASSSLAGYAATCQRQNLPGWLGGLARRINVYNEAAHDGDRVALARGGYLVRLPQAAKEPTK